MKGAGGVKVGGYGPGLVWRPVAGCDVGGFGDGPVIHPVAVGGPVCRAVLGGSMERSAAWSTAMT
jgi:hypothetical protein